MKQQELSVPGVTRQGLIITHTQELTGALQARALCSLRKLGGKQPQAVTDAIPMQT